MPTRTINTIAVQVTYKGIDLEVKGELFREADGLYWQSGTTVLHHGEDIFELLSWKQYDEILSLAAEEAK